jgi:hypothetical protein
MYSFIYIYKMLAFKFKFIRNLTLCTSQMDNLRSSPLFSYLGSSEETKISRNNAVNYAVYCG